MMITADKCDLCVLRQVLSCHSSSSLISACNSATSFDTYEMSDTCKPKRCAIACCIA